MTRRCGFSFVELLVVIGILGIFASLVIPGLASTRLPIGTPIEHALEADLRHARTEAIARARPVVLVVARDGSGWWIASESNPGEPIDATLRTFGRGALAELEGASIAASVDGEDSPVANDADAKSMVLARFDATGGRDERTATITARDAKGARAATWTLGPGRTRLATVDMR